MNTLDFALNPQAALDTPRWIWSEGKKVHVERSLPQHIAETLTGKGHQIKGEVGGGHQV